MSTRPSSSETIPVPAVAAVDDAAECDAEAGPPSEVRAIELVAGKALVQATLVIVTSICGAEAAQAWITVTRPSGVVAFEGPLEDDGRATLAIGIAPGGSRVSIRLETLRWHRQAEVGLRPGMNAYAFS